MSDQRNDEPFRVGALRLAAALSPSYGALCGATCAIAAKFPVKEAVLFGGFFGLVIGFLCIPFLALFFHRHHTVLDSLRVILLPSVLCAGVGGLAHGAFGILLSVTAYITLASFVKLRDAMPLRFPIGHCQSCGYDLSGLNATRCPECGSSSTFSNTNRRP